MLHPTAADTSDEEDQGMVMSRIEQQRFRRRNGRPDWSKINSMPDLFIRPDQRGDIKTFTSANVVPKGRNVLSTSTHRNGVGALSGSRWDASESSHAVELTPPTVRGLVTPSSGRRTKWGPATNASMKLIQPVPFSFERPDSSLATNWSATRQPKKSAMKKKRMMGGGLGTRFHSSVSAIEDFDFMSASSDTLTSCSLVKNHSYSSEASSESAADVAANRRGCFNEGAAEVFESRWKALSGPLNEHADVDALPSSPTCPRRRVTSQPSDDSLSCPPPLTTYADDDDTTADKSFTSYGSMDLVIEDDQDEPKKAQPADGAVDEEDMTNSAPDPDSKSKVVVVACSSYHSNASKGSTGTLVHDQIQLPTGPSLQFDTPKSESQRVIENFPNLQTSEPVRHSDSHVKDSDMERPDSKWRRKSSPTSVTKELDIAVNEDTLRSCKAINPNNWALDGVDSRTRSSKDSESKKILLVKHLTKDEERLTSAAGSHELFQALPLVSPPFKAKEKVDGEWNSSHAAARGQIRDGDVTRNAMEGTIALLGKGTIRKKPDIVLNGAGDSNEAPTRKNGVLPSASTPRQKRRGSTGTLAKRYEECITSSYSVSPAPVIRADRTESTGSLVQRWEAKIREKKISMRGDQIIDNHELLNMPDLSKATAEGYSSTGGAKPSWRQGRQTRRGSTGILVKKFEETFIPAARLSSTHHSSQLASNGPKHPVDPSNATIDLVDLATKPNDAKPPMEGRRQSIVLPAAVQNPLDDQTQPASPGMHMRSMRTTDSSLDPNETSTGSIQKTHLPPKVPCVKVTGPKTGNESEKPNQDNGPNMKRAESNVATKAGKRVPNPVKAILTPTSLHNSCGSLQSTHTFETSYGSIALNDDAQPSEGAPLHQDARLAPSSVRGKPKLEHEHALSPRGRQAVRVKVGHQRQRQQQQHQEQPQDLDLTPRQGRKQQRRGSTGALAKKFEEELIPAARPSPIQKLSSPLSAPTNRRRGSIGAIARKWEEYTTHQVGSPPFAT
jgi:hypothetical protein